MHINPVISDNVREMERALECKDLERVLEGEMGAFSLRYLFINAYNNYINSKASNPDFRAMEAKKKVQILGDSASIIKKLIRHNNCEPIDVLFISRERKVNVKTSRGYIFDDYIFYSLIDELKEKHPELRLFLQVVDNNDKRYEYIKPSELLRSVRIGLATSSKWFYYKKYIINYLKRQNCINVDIWATSFFSIRSLIGNALIGYSLKNIIDTSNPKVIISNDDSVYTKPLNDKDRRFIVLQSARMVEYGEYCKRLIFEKEPDLMPDYFLASGEYFAEMKRRYKGAKKVVVVGLPRYDVLFKPERIYSKSEFLQNHGIDSKQKLLLWTTQSHAFSDEENSANFRSVFNTLKTLKGVTLVVKQHPAESQKYTDIINMHIKEYGISALVTPKDSDTYELIFISDLMITRHSTTATEAVALNKPVIILNLSGEPDPVEYVKEGVAKGVYREEDLCAAIMSLLENDSALAANREMYINNYLYKIDGKATNRAVSIILDMLNER